MLVDDPRTLAEVTEALEAYDSALLDNDTATLDAMFLHSCNTIRYGVSEVQYGIDEVRSFRAAQKPFERALSRTLITAYGHDTAIASTLFHRGDFPGQVGRQMQTWVKTEAGWRVVAAHVSMMAELA